MGTKYPPQLLKMKTEIVIGIDIGGTNSPYGIIDRDGKILAEGRIDTQQYAQPDRFVRDLSNKIKGTLSELGEGYELLGIGVGAPNGNYHNGTIEFAPNLPWKGIVNLIKLFSAHFDVPVFVTNDANAAAIGEMVYGKAKDLMDFVVITLGTGLGSGFVANGKLIYGHDSFAGELGHTTVELDGRECACGRKGCLETYASATGIVRTANILLARSSKNSSLRKISTNSITGLDITNAARNGDTLALEIFDFTAQKLAFSLANVVAITSPKAIILFGGLANSGNLLIEPTKRYMEQFLLNIYKNKVDLLLSDLNENNAAILGAGAMVWEENKQEKNEKIRLN